MTSVTNENHKSQRINLKKSPSFYSKSNSTQNSQMVTSNSYNSVSTPTYSKSTRLIDSQTFNNKKDFQPKNNTSFKGTKTVPTKPDDNLKFNKKDSPNKQKKLSPSIKSSSKLSKTKKLKTPASPNGPTIETCARQYSRPIVRAWGDFVVDKTEPSPTKSVKKKAQSLEDLKIIGKQRETPKTRRTTVLKRTILNERTVRRSCSVLPLSDVVIDEQLDYRNCLNKFIGINNNTLDLQNQFVSSLLSKLAKFQDRDYVTYADSPFYRNRNKRFVCGFHEVIKYLKAKSVRLIFIANNLEGKATSRFLENQNTVQNHNPSSSLSTPSALEKMLSTIFTLANNTSNGGHSIPILITLNRKLLARLVHKPGHVSVIAILSVEGAIDVEKDLLALNTNVNVPVKSCLQSDESSDNVLTKMFNLLVDEFRTMNTGLSHD